MMTSVHCLVTIIAKLVCLVLPFCVYCPVAWRLPFFSGRSVVAGRCVCHASAVCLSERERERERLAGRDCRHLPLKSHLVGMGRPTLEGDAFSAPERSACICYCGHAKSGLEGGFYCFNYRTAFIEEISYIIAFVCRKRK